MAQQVEAFAIKPDDVNEFHSATLMEENTDSCKPTSDLHTWSLPHVHPHMYMHRHTNVKMGRKHVLRSKRDAFPNYPRHKKENQYSGDITGNVGVCKENGEEIKLLKCLE